ncbi:MAG TPA: hypothetical protein VLI05_05985 [Candidatus Saccharimonadia bacterium]|nr:hypothetical protein [Candidatus Saccharimonadia bacterium]
MKTVVGELGRRLRPHWWWLVLATTGLVGCAGLVIGWVRVLAAHDATLGPIYGFDDPLYYQLMAAGRLCLHNATSLLADGGCRVRPVWWIGGLLSFGQPALGGLLLRVITLAALALVLGWGARQWARREGLPELPARNLLVAGLVLSPLPLALLMPYAIGVSDLTLSESLVFSPPNLLSWLLYTVTVGGLYVYRDRPQAWPFLGLVAGFWGLNHPFFLGFMLSLFGLWLVIEWRQTRRHWLAAVALVVPPGLAGLYYIWLSRVNQFFQFHLISNVTRHYPGMVWWLAAAITMVVIMAWYGYYRTQVGRSRPLPDRFLLLWVAVAGLWQFVPQPTERRLVLILALPLALLVARMLLSTSQLWVRRAVAGLWVSNGLMLLAVALSMNAPLFGRDVQRYMVTPRDQQFAQQLSPPGRLQRYLADIPAANEFLWQTPLLILNGHQFESPRFDQLNRALADLRDGHSSCQAFAQRVAPLQLDGLVLQRAASARLIARLAACGSRPLHQNATWTVMTPPAARAGF